MITTVFTLVAFAQTPVTLNDFTAVDATYNIDKRIFYSVCTGESARNPYAIGVYGKERGILALKKWLNTIGVQATLHKRNPEESRRLLSISPTTPKQALLSLQGVKRTKGVGYDMGAMQINMTNAKSYNWSEERLLLDKEFNIDKGAIILRGCFDRVGDPYYALECYNKGSDRKKYDGSYANKILRIYREHFVTK